MIPEKLISMIRNADCGWHATLKKGLEAVDAADPTYLDDLMSSDFLPTNDRLFAAFSIPIDEVKYVLVGEGPYPRAASATGVCFMDGAVEGLWSEAGLSKPVNRATSLRNFMKMLLVASGELQPESTNSDAVAAVAMRAQKADSGFIQTLMQLQTNLINHGFLLLNAALAFRSDVAPIKEAKAWQPFFSVVLAALLEHAKHAMQSPPTLTLWGKIAGQVTAMPVSSAFPQVIAEHPYNLTFVINPAMHALFGPMTLLKLA